MWDTELASAGSSALEVPKAFLPVDGRSDRLSFRGSLRLRNQRAILLSAAVWPSILIADSPAGVTFDSSDAPSLQGESIFVRAIGRQVRYTDLARMWGRSQR